MTDDQRSLVQASLHKCPKGSGKGAAKGESTKKAGQK